MICSECAGVRALFGYRLSLVLWIPVLSPAISFLPALPPTPSSLPLLSLVERSAMPAWDLEWRRGSAVQDEGRMHAGQVRDDVRQRAVPQLPAWAVPEPRRINVVPQVPQGPLERQLGDDVSFLRGRLLPWLVVP